MNTLQTQMPNKKGTSYTFKLGARLDAVYDLVRPGFVVADVGCDHGKLDVYLALSHKSPYVIAIDQKQLPLERAMKLIKKVNCETMVTCRLGNGLSVLKPNEAQEIVVAGMSGETIADIVTHCEWIKNKEVHLILQPTTRHSQLRQALGEAGFMLQQEKLVFSKNRYYVIISAFLGNEKCHYDKLFYEIGLSAQNEDKNLASGYINDRLKRLKKKQVAKLPLKEKEDLKELITQMEETLLCIKQSK